MEKTYSRYKLLGGFGLLLVGNGLIGFLTYNLLSSAKFTFDVTELTIDKSTLIVYTAILGLNTLFFVVFMTDCKFIVADSEGITFINPLIPILRRKRKWTYFDYFINVDEHARYNTHEAVWFIRNGRVKGRFSSFYYSNYEDLQDQIKTKGLGKRKINKFTQLFIRLRMKRIKY